LVQFQDLTSRRLKRDAPWVGALRAKEYYSKNRHKLKDKKIMSAFLESPTALPGMRTDHFLELYPFTSGKIHG